MQTRERQDDVLDDAVGKIVIGGIAATILQRQDGYRRKRLAVQATWNDDLWRIDGERISPYGFIRILELEITNVSSEPADSAAHHVVDMDFKASAELLVRLRDWATRPELVYRHHWSVGDLVIRDNTGTMHRATPYDPDSGRLLHRTKREGEEPFA